MLAGVAAGVVLLLLITGIVLVTSGSSPREAVTATSNGLQNWAGATYRGQVPDGTGGQGALEITVDRQGNATGTITRPGGGRAEFVITGSEEAIRGDQAWWQRSAPRSRLAERLTNVWVSGANSQLPGVTGWATPPAQLASSLSGDRPWSEDDEQTIDGVNARTFVDGADRVSVDDNGDNPRLVGFDLTSFGYQRSSPVTAQEASPQALGNLSTLIPQVSGMPDYTATITARPQLTVTFESATSCNTPTCTETIRLVNSGTLRGTGQLVVTLDTSPIATYPFDSAPGSNQVFNPSYPNPAYAGGGGRQALVRAQLVNVE